MSLFGGSKSVKTTVKTKPDPAVEKILKQQAERITNMKDEDFIAHEYADLSPEATKVLSNLEQSGQLKELAGMLSPRFTQGMQQLADNNKALQSEVNAPTDVNQILAKSQVLKNGLQKVALNQGLSGTSSQLSSNAAVRRGLKTQGAAISANAANNPTANQIAGNLAMNAQGSRIQGLGLRSGVAGTNLDLGTTGAQLSNQAAQNAMQANLLQQQNANQRNQYAYENANAESLWPFQQLQTKSAFLNTLSPMAGSTSVNQEAGISKGQQLLGQGIALGGSLANTYFSGVNANQQAALKAGGGVANSQGYTDYMNKNGGFLNTMASGMRSINNDYMNYGLRG